MAVTAYMHDGKILVRQGKVRFAPVAFSVEVTTTTTPQDFKLYLAGASSLKITWGDTNEDTYTGSDGNKTHSYATPGTYTITFVSGTATTIAFGQYECTPALLTKVKTAIPIGLGLTSAYEMFKGCSNCASWAPNFFDAAFANITDAGFAFFGNTTFNEPVNGWNTSNLVAAIGMFSLTTSFNQPMNNWNTSSLQTMTAMFEDSTAFNQDLSNWNVTSLLNASSMLSDTSFSQTNYDLLLVAWAAQAVQNDVYFYAGSAHYSAGAPTTAHDHLTGVHNWTIFDGGTP